MLKKHGEVNEGRLGFRRIFVPGGRPVPTAGEALLMREKSLVAMRDWIAANPGRPQMDLLAAMTPVAESVTQHRLKRLVAAGVVEERATLGRRHALHLRLEPAAAQGLGLTPAHLGLEQTKACPMSTKATGAVEVAA